MKRIKVIAHAQYDDNDFRRGGWYRGELEKLAANGIDVEIAPYEEGVERVKNTEPFDILVVDYWRGKCSEDTVKLCRQLHPEAKVVMIDMPIHWSYMSKKEKANARKTFDYWCLMESDGTIVATQRVVEIVLGLKMRTFDEVNKLLSACGLRGFWSEPILPPFPKN